MAENPSPPKLPGKSQPLRTIRATPDGVGISSDYINSIIDRIEDLVQVAQNQKPVPGNNIQINFTAQGAVINAVTQ
jgi:hypothetical protein